MTDKEIEHKLYKVVDEYCKHHKLETIKMFGRINLGGTLNLETKGVKE